MQRKSVEMREEEEEEEEEEECYTLVQLKSVGKTVWSKVRTPAGELSLWWSRRERERESLLGTALNDGVKGKKDEGEEGRRKEKKEMRTKVGGLVGDLGTLDNP